MASSKSKNDWFSLSLEERKKRLDKIIEEIVSSVKCSPDMSEDKVFKLEEYIQLLYNSGCTPEDMKVWVERWKDAVEGR
jgi:ATP-dependent DNA ligase